MSLELAEQLGLQAVGTYRVSGLGNYATEVVRVGPLQIGEVRFPAADYAVLPDIHRYGYDLVLGADILAQSRVTIDNARHTVVFAQTGDAPAPASLPITFHNFIPVIDVALDGVPAQLSVDTGDQSAINLSEAFYTAHPSLFSISESRWVAGVGGESVEMLGRIGAVRVGDYDLGPQPIGVTRTLQGTADGHLGAGFLSAFTVMLDYPHARFALVPRGGSR